MTNSVCSRSSGFCSLNFILDTCRTTFQLLLWYGLLIALMSLPFQLVLQSTIELRVQHQKSLSSFNVSCFWLYFEVTLLVTTHIVQPVLLVQTEFVFIGNLVNVVPLSAECDLIVYLEENGVLPGLSSIQ